MIDTVTVMSSISTAAAAVAACFSAVAAWKSLDWRSLEKERQQLRVDQVKVENDRARQTEYSDLSGYIDRKFQENYSRERDGVAAKKILIREWGP